MIIFGNELIFEISQNLTKKRLGHPEKFDNSMISKVFSLEKIKRSCKAEMSSSLCQLDVL